MMTEVIFSLWQRYYLRFECSMKPVNHSKAYGHCLRAFNNLIYLEKFAWSACATRHLLLQPTDLMPIITSIRTQTKSLCTIVAWISGSMRFDHTHMSRPLCKECSIFHHIQMPSVHPGDGALQWIITIITIHWNFVTRRLLPATMPIRLKEVQPVLPTTNVYHTT